MADGEFSVRYNKINILYNIIVSSKNIYIIYKECVI